MSNPAKALECWVIKAETITTTMIIDDAALKLENAGCENDNKSILYKDIPRIWMSQNNLLMIFRWSWLMIMIIFMVRELVPN